MPTRTAGTSTNATEPEEATQASGGAKAGADEQAAERSGGSAGTIKYTGDAGVREISKADWKTAGIEHDSARWDADNDYTLPLSMFSADAIEILKRDRGLKISQS